MIEKTWNVTSGVTLIPALFIFFSVLVAAVIGYGIYSTINVQPSLVTNQTEVVNESANEIDPLEELGVNIQFASDWGLPEVKTDEEYPDLEGIGRQVNFNGTGALTFGSRVQLHYSTLDYSPGRGLDAWGALLRFHRTQGIEAICNTEPNDPTLTILRTRRDCMIQELNGKFTATFLSQINSLDGEGVYFFIKVFVFETNSEQFPLAAFILYQFVDPPIQTTSVEPINNQYDALRNKQTDEATNKLLVQFENTVMTLSYGGLEPWKL